MHQRLIEITSDAEDAVARLLTAYSAEALYNFRVAARRCRSILKQIDNHRSRGLRKAWGGLAAVTGPARDWDVFKHRAELLLTPEDHQRFLDINRERIDSSREAVLEMIQSAPWHRHLQDWNAFLLQLEDGAGFRGHAEIALESAILRAGEVLSVAMREDSDRRWHKFRIAVKEVRYVAEAAASDNEQAADIAQSCRELQTLLGDWHDTVVQLNLLQDLEPAPVHQLLETLVWQRQQDFMSRMHASLEQESLFATPRTDP